jgi:hypothetical protein
MPPTAQCGLHEVSVPAELDHAIQSIVGLQPAEDKSFELHGDVNMHQA